MTNKKNQSHFFENDKSLNEFINSGYTVLFDEYKLLKKSTQNIFNDSKLPDFYKEEILFEMVEQVRMNNRGLPVLDKSTMNLLGRR